MREEVKSERIVLRRYQNDFAPLLYEAAIESRGGEFSRWMPWCHEDYTLAESESFMARCIEGWDKKTEFNFAIFNEFDSDFLGGVGLNQFNSQYNFANLGYWIRTSRQNRGAASARQGLWRKRVLKIYQLIESKFSPPSKTSRAKKPR